MFGPMSCSTALDLAAPVRLSSALMLLAPGMSRSMMKRCIAGAGLAFCAQAAGSTAASARKRVTGYFMRISG
jgi:hypothetical protein